MSASEGKQYSCILMLSVFFGLPFYCATQIYTKYIGCPDDHVICNFYIPFLCGILHYRKSTVSSEICFSPNIIQTWFYFPQPSFFPRKQPFSEVHIQEVDPGSSFSAAFRVPVLIACFFSRL